MLLYYACLTYAINRLGAELVARDACVPHFQKCIARGFVEQCMSAQRVVLKSSRNESPEKQKSRDSLV